MDINIILGVLLILIVIYFLALVFSLRMRNRQADQAAKWNKYRDHIVTQAQEDQVQAHRISLRLRKQYKDLDSPYDEDRDKAIAILEAISENAQTILNDQNNRPPIEPAPEPYSWKTFLISPIYSEYRTRREWWETTQRFGSRLSKNPPAFSSIDKLEKRLTGKGEITKGEFEKLKEKTNKLTEAFHAEARTSAHFQDQIQQLERLTEKIDQSISSYLSGPDFSPKQVAAAVSNLRRYQGEWQQFNLTLKKSKQIRRDSRSHLQKNQDLIDSIEVLLRSENETHRPIRKFRQALDLEINFIEEQEQKRETGIYLISPIQDQYSRLKEIEKDLQVLIQERKQLEGRISHGEREIMLTKAWIETVEPPFVVDQTNIILETVQEQQFEVEELIRSSEDLDLSGGQLFIDPKKLAASRTKFDQQITTYRTVHQGLQQQIAPAVEGARLAIQNLRPLNVRYHKGLILDTLFKEVRSFEDGWMTSREPSQIRESQIERVIADLFKLENTLQDIKSATKKTEQGYQESIADRMDALRIIEDQRFTEYHQVMQVIARERQLPLSEQARVYADQAEELNKVLEQINTDFLETATQAAALLAGMNTLWESYQKKYAAERKSYQKVLSSLTNLKNDLKKYGTHVLSAFRTRATSPLTVITDWLQIRPPQSIEALLTHNDEGYDIQVEIERTVKEIIKEDQKYTWAKEEAVAALADAKTAIQVAEKDLTKILWGSRGSDEPSQTSGKRKPELEHSYRYLDTAETAYREITDHEIEYHNSVEKAVSDLDQRVRQNANNAKEEAKEVTRETREQINDIAQKCEDLEKTLAQGQGYSARLEDTGFRSQWAQINLKYSQYATQLEQQTTYREAFRYLEQALIESRYLIERMREFEDSR